MGDTVKFAPNTGTSPSFSGKGSVIQHPDILPIFLGSAWPIGAPVTSNDIMKALYLIAGGPYLRGLQQYGCAGTASVRNAIIDSRPFTVSTPAGTTQPVAITSAVRAYLASLVDDDRIDNVDDNHELIVLIFLDPSTQQAGNVSGANVPIEIFEFLDDNTRFQWAWVLTSSNSLDSITQTLSHELVESISDPFNNGWEQTSPTPGPNAGQICDVCANSAVVNGVAVASYWSASDNACIVPTSGTRRLSLSHTLADPVPNDGPTLQGYVDFPIICGGGRYYDFTEKTFLNVVTVHSAFDGYELPLVDYKINGQPVPFMGGTIDVAATREVPSSNPLFPDIPTAATARLNTWRPSLSSPEMKIQVGPNEGNTSLRVDVTVRESFDDPAQGGGSTIRRAYLDIDLHNQEIHWEPGHDHAVHNCQHNAHLSDGVGRVLGPPRPGDPPGMPDAVLNALQDRSASRSRNLTNAAELVHASRPEVAQALLSLAQRAKQVAAIG